jgi:hypothetical protein
MKQFKSSVIYLSETQRAKKIEFSLIFFFEIRRKFKLDQSGCDFAQNLSCSWSLISINLHPNYSIIRLMKSVSSKYNMLLTVILLVVMIVAYPTEIRAAQQLPVSSRHFSQIEFQVEDNFTINCSSISSGVYAQVKTTNYSDDNFSNESFLSITSLYLKEIKRSALKGAFRNIKI